MNSHYKITIEHCDEDGSSVSISRFVSDLIANRSRLSRREFVTKEAEYAVGQLEDHLKDD